MGRTAWLQDRRMKKFLDVLGRYEKRKLSALEAGEILGRSERQFRRWRDRYEEEGLDGLIDKRLGKASAKPVSADQLAWTLEQYRTQYRGWNVKHFHEHLEKRYGFLWSYTSVKTQLQVSGLIERAPRRGAHRRKRERRPRTGIAASGRQPPRVALWASGAGSDRDHGRCDEHDLLDVSGRGGNVRPRACGPCWRFSRSTAYRRASIPSVAATISSRRRPVGRWTRSVWRRSDEP